MLGSIRRMASQLNLERQFLFAFLSPPGGFFQSDSRYTSAAAL